MASLYELDQSVLAVLDGGFVIDEETGEILFDSENLDALQMERSEKMESIALFVKNLESDASAIKTEEKSLATRRGVKERKAERLKRYLSDSMNAFGETRVETPRCALSFRKSEAVEITDPTLIDSAYLKTADPQPDKTAIKKALKSGVEIQGAQLIERQNLQIR